MLRKRALYNDMSRLFKLILLFGMMLCLYAIVFCPTFSLGAGMFAVLVIYHAVASVERAGAQSFALLLRYCCFC